VGGGENAFQKTSEVYLMDPATRSAEKSGIQIWRVLKTVPGFEHFSGFTIFST